MNNTRQIVKEIQDIINTNKECQEIMTYLAAEAEKRNLTMDQWKECKIKLLESVFLSIAQDDADIQKLLAEDVWKLFN